MWGYILWAEDIGLDKMGNVPSTRKHAFIHCLLLLCCGCSVTRYLKLLMLTSHTVMDYNLETWAETNPFPLSYFCRSISSQQHKGDRDTGNGRTWADEAEIGGVAQVQAQSGLHKTVDSGVGCTKTLRPALATWLKLKRKKLKIKNKNLQLYCVIDKGCL